MVATPSLLTDFEEAQRRDRFILVDGHALIYRAYHAFPGLTSPEGLLVNAVYGFTRILLAAIRDLEPVYIAVAFDHKAPTKRSEDFKDYKAHRPAMPDDLRPQIEIIKQVVDALNIPRFELAGFEADDLIGTIACLQSTDPTAVLPEGAEPVLTTIVTGDKDLLQLVTEHVHVWMPGRNKQAETTEYDPEKVLEKLGIWPDQVPDLKALMGDASDNIPGVGGIGPKTATTLIQTFGSLDALYAAVDKVAAGETIPEAAALKESVLCKLVTDREQAYLSRQLATIECAVELDFELELCRVTNYDKTKVVELFDQLDFKSLLPLLPKDQFESAVQEALF